MLIMDLPEEPLTKARKAKEARERKKAEAIANIESQMSELQASLVHENIPFVERKQARAKTKAALENLIAEQEVWVKKNATQLEPKQPQESAENLRQELTFLMTKIMARIYEMRDLDLQELLNIEPIISKKETVMLLLKKLPKRQRATMEERYSPQFEKIKTLGDHLSTTLEELPFYSKKITDPIEKLPLPLPSQPSSSHSAIIPTPSTSSFNLSSEPHTQIL